MREGDADQEAGMSGVIVEADRHCAVSERGFREKQWEGPGKQIHHLKMTKLDRRGISARPWKVG